MWTGRSSRCEIRPPQRLLQKEKIPGRNGGGESGSGRGPPGGERGDVQGDRKAPAEALRPAALLHMGSEIFLKVGLESSYALRANEGCMEGRGMKLDEERETDRLNELNVGNAEELPPTAEKWSTAEGSRHPMGI